MYYMYCMIKSSWNLWSGTSNITSYAVKPKKRSNKRISWNLWFTPGTARTAFVARSSADTLLPPQVVPTLSATIITLKRLEMYLPKKYRFVTTSNQEMLVHLKRVKRKSAWKKLLNVWDVRNFWKREVLIGGWSCKLTSSTWHPVEQRQHFARLSSSRSPAPPCCTPPSSAPPPAIHTPGFRCSGFPAWRRLLGSVGSFLVECSRGWEDTDCGSSRSDQGQSLHLHLLLKTGHGSEWNSAAAGDMLAWSWFRPTWLTPNLSAGFGRVSRPSWLMRREGGSPTKALNRFWTSTTHCNTEKTTYISPHNANHQFTAN